MSAIFLSGCSDLSIFVPPIQAPLFSKFSHVEVNEDGLLQLEWQTKIVTDSGRFQIYLAEVDAATAPFQFSSEATHSAPLTSEEIEIDAAVAPKNTGRLLSSVRSLEFIWSELLSPGQTYALQIVENGRPSRSSQVK